MANKRKYGQYDPGYTHFSYTENYKKMKENSEETSSDASVRPMSSSYRNYRNYRSKRTYPKKKLSFPRGPNKYGQYKSRAPYRVLNPNMAPELKYFDTVDLLPFPFSYGNVRSGNYNWNTSAPGTVDPYQTWTGGNIGCFVLGSLRSGATDWLYQAGMFREIAQGTGANNRIGTKIFAKSLYLQMSIRSPVPATVLGTADGNQSPVSYRVVCIMDRQPNSGNIPPADTVFQPTTHINSLQVQPNSPNNLDNRDRFKTLFDIKDTLSPQGSEVRIYEKYQKLNFQVQYAANGGVNTNDIYVFFISDGYVGNIKDQSGNPVFADTRPYCKLTARLRYTDC